MVSTEGARFVGSERNDSDLVGVRAQTHIVIPRGTENARWSVTVEPVYAGPFLSRTIVPCRFKVEVTIEYESSLPVLPGPIYGRRRTYEATCESLR